MMQLVSCYKKAEESRCHLVAPGQTPTPMVAGPLPALHPAWPSPPWSAPDVPGLQGTIALQFLDQHLTAPPYHIPDFPQGAAALEGATAILHTETQAGAMAEWHRSSSGMLQMSGQEPGLAPNTLLPACTEDLPWPRAGLLLTTWLPLILVLHGTQ